MEPLRKDKLPIIRPEDLVHRMDEQNLVIIDARSGRDAFERYAAQHLKGALHVDLEKDLSQRTSDAANGGRHPLPDIKSFGSLLGKLGINPFTQVVVYDDKEGANAAARFWWMLKAVGHEHVQVIDGGLNAAIRASLPVSGEVVNPVAISPYPVKDWKLPLVSMDTVAKATADSDYLVIDVRERYRYRGESEPIDLVAGHIPHALNIPYSENLADDGFFLSAEKLAAKYKSIIGDRKPSDVIVHCGSGVTACHTLLAMEQAGLTGANLYVGSWSEWSRNQRPIATGE